ncbi:META domain-containing protein [Trinickia terrae]|uniref:META domain-containing protein n=1 Tax=Trinickia terrae TaxID=2571161 RepID=A0A4U1HPD9_9BURK|nr:META domain-containing protein [Trinickia terrae]TKC83161.1 META domain-containing protein [Trinickia terrae]
MPNQSTAPRRATAFALARMSMSALTVATLVAACAMPKHPDSSAPPSDPFNPAATQLLDDTRWELVEWKNADGSTRAVPQAGGGALTLDFSTADGQRRVSGFAGCNRYTGGYVLKNGGLSFGPLASTKKACPAAAADLESAYLDALAHVAKSGVQMKPPQQLQIALGDGATLIFSHPGGQ